MEENKPITRSYNSVEEMWESFEQEKKEHPIRTFFENIGYCLSRYWNYPGDLCTEIKWFVQRGTRGYSDSDVWCVGEFVSKVLPPMLKQLKETKHGIPSNMFNKEDSFDKHGNAIEDVDMLAEKRWDEILNNIIWTFETSNKIIHRDWIYIEDERKRTKQSKFFEGLNESNKKSKLFKDCGDYYIMSKKENERYKKGWKLFEKHFYSLWD